MMKFDLRTKKRSENSTVSDIWSICCGKMVYICHAFEDEHLLDYCWVLKRTWGKAFRNLGIEHLGTMNISLWDSVWDWIITESTSGMTSYWIKSQSLGRNIASPLPIFVIFLKFLGRGFLTSIAISLFILTSAHILFLPCLQQYLSLSFFIAFPDSGKACFNVTVGLVDFTKSFFFPLRERMILYVGM